MVTYEQAKKRLEQYRLDVVFKSSPNAPAFYGVLTDKANDNEAFIVHQYDNKITPRPLSPEDVVSLAVHDPNSDTVVLPLQERLEPADIRLATLTPFEPKPHLKWQITIDFETHEESLKSKADLPKALHKCIESGATAVNIQTTEPLRKHILTKRRRAVLISDALTRRNKSLTRWCKDNDLPYNNVHKEIARGDGSDEIRQKICADLRLNLNELWPVIAW